MDETKANTEAEQNLENQDEIQQDAEVTEEQSEETTETDIDFKVAPETVKTSKRTELEKAEYSARSVLNKVAELGGDPAKVAKDFVPETDKEATGGFTRNDADQLFNEKLAEQHARSLAKSDKEFQAIMSWVKIKGLSVEDAHLLANRGKVKQATAEIQRAQEATASSNSAGAGVKTQTTKVPQMPIEMQQVLRRRGMKQEGGKWVGKITEMVYSPSDPSANSIGWVTRKIQKS